MSRSPLRTPSVAASSPMSAPDPSPRPREFWRLAQKELRESLRDRRTILTLVSMPLLIYPLLAVVLQKFLVAELTASAPLELRIGVGSEADGKTVGDALRIGGELTKEQRSKSRNEPNPTPNLPGLPNASAAEPELALIGPRGDEPLDLEDLVRQGEFDLGLLREVGEADGDGDPSRVRWRLLYNPESSAGRQALRIVRRRFEAINTAAREDAIRRAGLTDPAPLPFEIGTVRGETVPGFSLTTFVPLMLLLMTMTGAVYPAIDLTAGERERGTLEAVIAAPVSRFRILLAKFVAVLTVTIATALVNLIGLYITVTATGLSPLVFGDAGPSFGLLVAVVGLSIVFAGFFSAVLLGLTSLARSFKEAQAYLIPLMLLSLSPGILSLMPDLELTVGLALVPLVNIVLVGRDLLTGSLVPAFGVLAVVSTLLYMTLAIFLAARIFGTDAILYGSSDGWSELFARPDHASDRPTLTQGWITLAVLAVAFVLLAGVPGSIPGLGMSARLVGSMILTSGLFVGLPLLFCRWNRVQIGSGFGARSASIVAFAGAVILGLSLWPLVYELETLFLSVERLDRLQELFEGIGKELDRVPLAWKLVALAVTPAVCEELFFRGYLFAAFRDRLAGNRWNGPVTVIVTAAFFGLFHVLVRDALLFERFVPSFALGIAIGSVRWWSGSVWPGITLHLLHNGLLLTLADLEGTGSVGWLEKLSLDLNQHRHLPPIWWIVSLTGVTIGFALVRAGRRRGDAG